MDGRRLATNVLAGAAVAAGITSLVLFLVGDSQEGDGAAPVSPPVALGVTSTEGGGAFVTVGLGLGP